MFSSQEIGLSLISFEMILEDLKSESKSNINVQWRKIGQPINDRHFHYLSH